MWLTHVKKSPVVKDLFSFWKGRAEHCISAHLSDGKKIVNTRHGFRRAFEESIPLCIVFDDEGKKTVRLERIKKVISGGDNEAAMYLLLAGDYRIWFDIEPNKS